MNDLTAVPDSELNAELERRRVAAAKVESARKLAAAALLKKHAKLLLEFIPQHSRTSCSDKDPGNEDRGCTRCQLLAVSVMEEWQDCPYEILGFGLNRVDG